jgi:signal transduction histidine kinase/phage shock protein PspC (stress-responsive transcriptional regulator)
VAGVAGGIARRLGVDPVVIRIAFVVTALANGIGLIAYAIGWLVMPEATAAGRDRRPLALPWFGRRLGRGLRRLRIGRLGSGGADADQAVAVGLVVIGSLLLLRNLGLWFGDAFVWPVVLAGVGVAVIWARTPAQERARWSQLAAKVPGNPLAALTGGRTTLARALVGLLLVLSGVGVFFAANTDLAAVRQIGLAVLVTTVGLVLLLGPWVVRLTNELTAERRERIRSEERAEMATHLHDSVLQTLALVQRRADQPREVVSLARRQERELRAWLYPAAAERDPGQLAAVVEALAVEVETMHGIDVDVVAVGDRPLDDDVAALVAAVREAIVNAAKHSGAPAVSVYVEVAGGSVVASVRDRGRGFDPHAVPADRRGIADSITGRMTRHGGRATITSVPGEGTEVELELAAEPERT